MVIRAENAPFDPAVVALLRVALSKRKEMARLGPKLVPLTVTAVPGGPWVLLRVMVPWRMVNEVVAI